MSKEQATEKWVDALQNFMRTGLIGDDFHTRTRLVGEKGV